MLMFMVYAQLAFLAMLIEAAFGKAEGGARRRLGNAGLGVAGFSAAMVTAGMIPHLTGGLLLDLGGWQGPLATAACVFLLVAGYDLAYYWWHRAQHGVPVLWRIHSKHHDDETFDSSTYLRQNVLESSLQAILLGIPFSMAFAVPAEALVIAGATRAGLDFWIHLGLPIRMGRLTPLMTGPQLHRHHHARDEALGRGNYAAFIPAWDIAFGTYVAPERDAFPETGLWRASDATAIVPWTPRRDSNPHRPA